MPIIKTDSCAYSSQQLINTYNLRVISHHVLVNGKDYQDSEISPQNLFDSVIETGELPKTAAPSVHKFSNIFDIDEELI